VYVCVRMYVRVVCAYMRVCICCVEINTKQQKDKKEIMWLKVTEYRFH